jgi:hypothetical protein
MKTLSKYARLFDNTNVNWNANVLDSRRFLKCVERYANDLLKRRGTIFLNDIYEMLGFERTQTGQVVGWHYSKENPIGDNMVKFDLHGGKKGSIEIDFNVDGSVINYLKD